MQRVEENTVTLIIGGARSGKSSYAEQLAISKGDVRFYLATAVAFDQEMADKIAIHQKDRGSLFEKTIEEPLNIAKALSKNEKECDVILLDCTTVWLGNLLYNYGLKESYDEVDQFLKYLENPKTNVVIVSNEVGQGIVPADYESRFFRDQNGFINQKIAKLVDNVIFMVAGLPVVVKGK